MPASADPETLFQSVQESSRAVSRSKATASYLAMLTAMVWARQCSPPATAVRVLLQRQLRQHFLYFLPLPHGQGSLRPTPRRGFLKGSKDARGGRTDWVA